MIMKYVLLGVWALCAIVAAAYSSGLAWNLGSYTAAYMRIRMRDWLDAHMEDDLDRAYRELCDEESQEA